jgi:hypothetical protein
VLPDFEIEDDEQKELFLILSLVSRLLSLQSSYLSQPLFHSILVVAISKTVHTSQLKHQVGS